MIQGIDLAMEIVTSRRDLEAAWLNSLSLLEFIGARKISKTIGSSHPSLGTLEHLNLQTRHALTFKRLADGVAGQHAERYLCEDAARSYLHRLDQELSAWANDIAGREIPELNYLLVTLMLERRATSLYASYLEQTATDNVRRELKVILDEDNVHIEKLERRCLALLRDHNVFSLDTAETVDSVYFTQFMGTLNAALAPFRIRLSA